MKNKPWNFSELLTSPWEFWRNSVLGTTKNALTNLVKNIVEKVKIPLIK